MVQCGGIQLDKNLIVLDGGYWEPLHIYWVIDLAGLAFEFEFTFRKLRSARTPLKRTSAPSAFPSTTACILSGNSAILTNLKEDRKKGKARVHA